MGIKSYFSLSSCLLLAPILMLLLSLLAPGARGRVYVPEIIQEKTTHPDGGSGSSEVGALQYDQLHPKLVQWLEPYVDELPKPAKIFGYDVLDDGGLQPKLLTIGMFSKKMKFHRDLPATTVYAYGANRDSATFPGPAIEAVQGVPTYVRWENHLPPHHILPVDRNISIARTSNGSGVPTVVHLHGGIVPPQSDGNIDAWFTANFSERGPAWTTPTYTYPNVQHPGNLIYHDHARGITRLNVLAGLIGPYIIRNPAVEDELNLPRGDEFDRILLIADKKFKEEDGSIFMDLVPQSKFHVLWRPGYFGHMMTVNGKIWPYLRVQRRKYRFRIINASNSRYIDLRLTSPGQNLSFTSIGSDATFLAAPVTTPSIVLSNAEIADVVVDFSQVAGDSIELKNVCGYFPSTPLTPPQELVMKFLVDRNPTSDPSSIPPSLAPYAKYDMSEVSVTRYITYFELDDPSQEALMFKINGLALDDPATETPRIGSTELWNVINTVNDEHPIHVHLGLMQPVRTYKLYNTDPFVSCMNRTFDVERCNLSRHYDSTEYSPVEENMRTWKNVVRIPPVSMISIVIKFNLVETNTSYPFDATAFPGYLYHCHVLGHEDNEMIRPLKLVP